MSDPWHIPGGEICTFCGERFYSRSYGGPGICPSCDCGNFGPGVVKRQGARIAALEAQCCELEAALSGARKLIAEGRDANFNEVGECEDDDWLARIDAWLEATASETGAEQFCSCLMPFDKKPGPHHSSTCANYEPNRGEKP